MSLPDPLHADRVERLAHELSGLSSGGEDPPDTEPPGTQSKPVAHLRGAVRHAARRVARRVAKPALDRATAPGRQALERVAQLDRSVAAIRDDAADWDRERTDLHSAVVNMELLKGEVRALQEVLESLGRAIAPAFGLSSAAAALAELRERVTSCERRLRYLEQSGPVSRPTDASGTEAPDQPSPTPSSTLFDYAGFERRFRGPPAEVLAVLDERYGPLLESHPPVLDIGCGRAELVDRLTARGVSAMGVDTDPSMVADARERGLDVVQADGVSFLRSQPPGTFGSIVATHVLEHLALDSMIELLELSQTRLRPGGVFIAETPNPSSLIVLGNSYILDPTHVRPLHPKLLEFLCEAAGFRHVEVRFFAPASDYHLELITDPEAPAWTAQLNGSLERLNQVLFGPQDFAIVATTGDPVPAEALD